MSRYHAEPGRYPRYDETLDDVSSVDWSDLHPDNRADKPDVECLLVHPYLSFGDYDNSCAVERANVRVFRERFMDPDDAPEGVFFNVYGAYSSEAIGIRADYETRLAAHPDALSELRDVLNGLDDHPAINDEAVSELETELESEAWESYGASDFQAAIAREYAPWADALDDAAPSADALYDVWRELDDDGALQYVESGGVVYFGVDRAVSRMDSDDVARLLGLTGAARAETTRIDLWRDGRAAEARLHALAKPPHGFIFGDDSQIASVRAFEQYAESFPDYVA